MITSAAENSGNMKRAHNQHFFHFVCQIAWIFFHRICRNSFSAKDTCDAGLEFEQKKASWKAVRLYSLCWERAYCIRSQNAAPGSSVFLNTAQVQPIQENKEPLFSHFSLISILPLIKPLLGFQWDHFVNLCQKEASAKWQGTTDELFLQLVLIINLKWLLVLHRLPVVTVIADRFM